MKVLLVQPPIEDYYDTSIRTYPLGLLYIAARVRSVADVVIFDARTGARPIPVETSGFPELTPFYSPARITPFSFFDRYRRFGLTAEQIETRIAQESPDVVAIASMCSAYERQALEVAEAARRVSGGIVTVMGGTHPTLFPESILSSDCVDYCVRGEGETPFLKLVSALGRHKAPAPGEVEGLCFRKEDGRLHISGVSAEKDLDVLPERELLDTDCYRIGRKAYAFFLTSRGCPFSCGFCGKPQVPYRRLNVAAIEKDLDVCEKLGIGAIDFEDDMLNLHGDSFAQTLNLMKGRDFTLSAMNGIYPGNMDEPTLRLMFEAGFRRLNFSLVDMAEPVLRTQKRALHESFLRLLPFLDESPFLVEVHFIIGLPGQDPASLLDTVIFLMGMRLLLGPSLFYLAPGSPFHRDRPGGGEIPFRSMRSSAMLPFNPLFPRNVSFTFVKLVRFVNYVKQALDNDGALRRLSDLPGMTALAKDERKRTIIETLVRAGRFTYYDTGAGGFCDEPVDASLVRLFFEKAKGSIIRGYKTKNTLIMD
jgi:hypothetical protein